MMKPDLSTFYKNSEPSSPSRTHPISAKVIHLSEHKVNNKRASPQKPFKSKYYIQRKNIEPQAKNAVVDRLQRALNRDPMIKALFICSTVCSLLAAFFFLGHVISK